MLDSYAYSHVVQETSIPSTSPEQTTDSAASAVEQIPGEEFPNLTDLQAHASESEHSFDTEFRFGLELILDGLESLIKHTTHS